MVQAESVGVGGLKEFSVHIGKFSNLFFGKLRAGGEDDNFVGQTFGVFEGKPMILFIRAIWFHAVATWMKIPAEKCPAFMKMFHQGVAHHGMYAGDDVLTV